MDEAAIIRAIVDAKHDEALLREYANMLVARGDHRGEYLHLELERLAKESSLNEVEDKLGWFEMTRPVDPFWLDEVLPLFIRSPMVGTFHASRIPTPPESKPFVSIGQLVNRHSIVCIIESLLVFNEIPSGMIGVVKEVLVRDGAPVEFGQPQSSINANQIYSQTRYQQRTMTSCRASGLIEPSVGRGAAVRVVPEVHVDWRRPGQRGRSSC